MPVLTRVEARGWRGRLVLGGVTLALTLGGATMLYPFLLMLSGAMRSDMDAADMGLLPHYLVDDAELVRKFLETKYNYDPVLMNRFRLTRDYGFRDARVDLEGPAAAVRDFDRFLREADLPDHWQVLGGTELYRGISCENHRILVETLRRRFDDDLAAFNAELGAPIRSWWQVSARIPRWEEARTVQDRSPLTDGYREALRASEPAERAPVNLTGLYLQRMVFPVFGMRDATAFREAYGLEIEDFESFALPRRVPPPEQAAFRRDWLAFVFGRHVNLSFVRSDASDADYQAFLRARFGTIENLRRYWHDAEGADFEDLRLPADRDWIQEQRREAYEAFLETLPPESLRLVGPEFAWRDWLVGVHGSRDAAARAHGLEAGAAGAIPMPLAALETQYVLDRAGALRRRYALRNFRVVARRMFVQGRPFLNTIIYVSLALLFSLTLQPLVAYALSRFQPPGTWKIIFIFVATMAFPPMVAMIPQFLIIQRLGLLNTFIALVLPVTVNGMLIFLLKGFFDSIPKDLYDAAVIDGASEFRIFWQITMAMSTPILAVVALNTFSAAWMSFMYPLIVCPDERMHVLAVWLQQFQQHAPGTAVFASIILASIPSLLIFLFAQRTIMRGIAVPSEK